MIGLAPAPVVGTTGQLGFRFDNVVFEGNGIRATRLEDADTLNEGAIRCTREARLREIECLDQPVYRALEDVVREATSRAQRKRRRSGHRGSLPALALVASVVPSHLHGRTSAPADACGRRRPRTAGGAGEDHESWDACERAYSIVLVEATEPMKHQRTATRVR